MEQRNIRIKQCRESGEHVLIVGQTHYGAGLIHVGSESDPMSNMWTDPTDYYQNLVRRVREYTDRPIVFRTHPIGDKEIRNRNKTHKQKHEIETQIEQERKKYK